MHTHQKKWLAKSLCVAVNKHFSLFCNCLLNDILPCRIDDAHTLSCLNNGMTGLAYCVSLRVAHPFLSNFHVNNTSDRCHGNNRSNYNMYIHDVAEASKLIVSRYIAESITTDAGRFSHVGRPLSTAYKTSTSFVRSGQRAEICIKLQCTSMMGVQILLQVLSQGTTVNNGRSHYAIRSERDCTMLSRGSLEVVSIGTSYVHCYSKTRDRVSCESHR